MYELKQYIDSLENELYYVENKIHELGYRYEYQSSHYLYHHRNMILEKIKEAKNELMYSYKTLYSYKTHKPTKNEIRTRKLNRVLGIEDEKDEDKDENNDKFYLY